MADAVVDQLEDQGRTLDTTATLADRDLETSPRPGILHDSRSSSSARRRRARYQSKWARRRRGIVIYAVFCQWSVLRILISVLTPRWGQALVFGTCTFDMHWLWPTSNSQLSETRPSDIPASPRASRFAPNASIRTLASPRRSTYVPGSFPWNWCNCRTITA